VVALSSPLLVGIYEKNILKKSYEKSEQTSDALPLVFNEIIQNYEINNIYFANGPGSFMAIKVAYIFLRTISIALGVNIFASDGFAFNNNSPIRALKNVYFTKKDGKISTKISKKEFKQEFFLPQSLEKDNFSKDCEPLYILPAV
jgi:tRNA A37 threonylcarbamoyladenosine modification protein TsaB